MSSIDAEQLLQPFIVGPGGQIITASAASIKATAVNGDAAYRATSHCSTYINGSLVAFRLGQVILLPPAQGAALIAANVPLVAI